MIERFLLKVKDKYVTFLRQFASVDHNWLLRGFNCGFGRRRGRCGLDVRRIGGRIAAGTCAQTILNGFHDRERAQVGLVAADGDGMIIARAGAVYRVDDGIEHFLLRGEGFRLRDAVDAGTGIDYIGLLFAQELLSKKNHSL